MTLFFFPQQFFDFFNLFAFVNSSTCVHFKIPLEDFTLGLEIVDIEPKTVKHVDFIFKFVVIMSKDLELITQEFTDGGNSLQPVNTDEGGVTNRFPSHPIRTVEEK